MAEHEEQLGLVGSFEQVKGDLNLGLFSLVLDVLERLLVGGVEHDLL